MIISKSFVIALSSLETKGERSDLTRGVTGCWSAFRCSELGGSAVVMFPNV